MRRNFQISMNSGCFKENFIFSPSNFSQEKPGLALNRLSHVSNDQDSGWLFYLLYIGNYTSEPVTNGVDIFYIHMHNFTRCHYEDSLSTNKTQPKKMPFGSRKKNKTTQLRFASTVVFASCSFGLKNWRVGVCVCVFRSKKWKMSRLIPCIVDLRVGCTNHGLMMH